MGPWLREKRLAANETLDDIATRLGVDVSTVSRFETGDCAFPADDLPVILSAYSLTSRQFADRASREAA